LKQSGERKRRSIDQLVKGGRVIDNPSKLLEEKKEEGKERED